MIKIQILRNISESNSNQAKKSPQLIVYSTNNIFLEKIIYKMDGQTSPRTFSNKSKLNASLNQQSEIIYNLYLFYV